MIISIIHGKAQPKIDHQAIYYPKESLQYEIKLGGFKIATMSYSLSESESNNKWIQARLQTIGLLGWFQSFDACFDSYLVAGASYPELAYRDIQSAGSVDVRWNWDFSINPVKAFVEDMNEHRRYDFGEEVYPLHDLLSLINEMRIAAPTIKREYKTKLLFSNHWYDINLVKGLSQKKHFNNRSFEAEQYLLTIESPTFASKQHQMEVFVLPGPQVIPFLIHVHFKYATLTATLIENDGF